MYKRFDGVALCGSDSAHSKRVPQRIFVAGVELDFSSIKKAVEVSRIAIEILVPRALNQMRHQHTTSAEEVSPETEPDPVEVLLQRCSYLEDQLSLYKFSADMLIRMSAENILNFNFTPVLL